MRKLHRLIKVMKKIFSIILPVSILALLILLFVFKNRLTEAASKAIQSQAGKEVVSAQSAYVDSAFNYVRNGQGYEVTFLEFGATGCSACRRMETVMKDIRQEYPGKVKVMFVNVSLPENHSFMLYYGVVAIPTQVLLNKQGNEYFRHSGYLSFEEMVKAINGKLISNSLLNS